MTGGDGDRESRDALRLWLGECSAVALLVGDMVRSWARGDECVDEMVRSCCCFTWCCDLAVFTAVLGAECIFGGVHAAPWPNESVPTAFSSVDALLRVNELAPLHSSSTAESTESVLKLFFHIPGTYGMDPDG
jgi:hypothetical protein